MTIDELIQEAYANAVAHGWHDEPRSFPEILMLLVSEIAEAMEEFRSHKSVTDIYYVEGKPEGIPIEIADLLIRVFDFCGDTGLPLREALEIKMKYNTGRSYRHNGKKL
jgi:NTP pyrophosphatase (non-canonical NTP hydrolase)